LTGLVVGLLTIVMAVPALASNGKSAEPHGRPASGLTIVVTGGSNPGVTYDSIALGTLPMKGRFQLLEETPAGSASQKMTEFGPGDRDYVGGRWWVDVNGDGKQNAGDLFFVCPLLGPGH
jgi:hypothetical protein